MSLSANMASLREALRLPGNDRCADCRAQQPTWASYNIGVFLCQDCAGIHRSLGSHVSKVRSVTLDFWDLDAIKMMLSAGNNRVNSAIECVLTQQDRISPAANSSARSAFIRAKYVEKRFSKREGAVPGTKPNPGTKAKSQPVDIFAGLNLWPSASKETASACSHQPNDLLAFGYTAEAPLVPAASDKRNAQSDGRSTACSSFSFINLDSRQIRTNVAANDRVEPASDKALLSNGLFHFS